ncbi:MAG: hypothetical protein AB1690_02595 [Candidatus Zixiibacteriota bacterium]
MESLIGWLLAVWWAMIIALGLVVGAPQIKKAYRELIDIIKGKEIKL